MTGFAPHDDHSGGWCGDGEDSHATQSVVGDKDLGCSVMPTWYLFKMLRIIAGMLHMHKQGSGKISAS